ncbi:MAG: hypothetical protein JSV09_11170 [Thermoplasmata archaeon]|nr:MAG: hypothetical protein JSV09_11170 [Thermoplasmata archaeon]
MYELKEIELSKNYLKEVIESIYEPFVVLGGWAGYFLVSDKYRETTGREYIGSRDIDLGFKMEEADLDKTAFAKSYKILINDLGFTPQSFRLFKQIHAETGEVLNGNSAKDIPMYQIIQIYVDLIVNKIPKGFQDKFGFTPIDEPLLDYVFKDDNYRKEIREFEKNIFVPNPLLLLATKLKSYPNRDKDHKRIKDACDIAVLLLFHSEEIDRDALMELIEPETMEQFKRKQNKEEIRMVSEIIDIDKSVVESSIMKIL